MVYSWKVLIVIYSPFFHSFNVHDRSLFKYLHENIKNPLDLFYFFINEQEIFQIL